MGKKSLAVAKGRRTAQRPTGRHNKELLARNAAAYTEARLAGIRAENQGGDSGNWGVHGGKGSGRAVLEDIDGL